jgi:hypothetical protein
VRSDRRRSPSAGHAHDKRDQEDHQDYEEQYLRDLVAVAAMPPNPKTAAMIEMIRNTSAQ